MSVISIDIIWPKSCQPTRNHIESSSNPRRLLLTHTKPVEAPKSGSSHLDGVDLPIVAQISSAPAIKMWKPRLRHLTVMCTILISWNHKETDETSIFFHLLSLICSKTLKLDLFQNTSVLTDHVPLSDATEEVTEGLCQRPPWHCVGAKSAMPRWTRPLFYGNPTQGAGYLSLLCRASLKIHRLWK